MDNIRNSQIISVIDSLSRVIYVDPKEANARLQKYSTMSDEEVIKDLSMFIYNKFRNDTELYEYFLSLIQHINPEITPNVEFMKSELDKMFLNMKDDANLIENHKIVNDTFKYLTELFNREGIDYCFVGALPCFIQKGIPLFRYHDDIDVMVNEEDIEKVKSLMESSGYDFSDLRFPSIDEYHEMVNNKPPHQVMASIPNSDFHIGFFTFRREKDDGITTTEYLQREHDGEVIVDRLERSYNPVGTNLRFNNTCEIDGLLAKVCSIEHVYDLKGCTKRPKDITDMEVLESYVNKESLKELRRNSNTRQIVKHVSKEEGLTM